MTRAVSEVKKRELFDVLSTPPYPSMKDAAEMAGLSPKSVYNLAAQDPAWRAEWQAAREADKAERRAVARDKLEALIGEAVDAAGAGLRSDDDSVQQRAAWKILEHFFGSARQSVDVSSQSHVVVTLELGRQDDGPSD